MANITASGRAICPYYQRSNTMKNGRAHIVCEGVIPETENIVTFHGRAKMEKWMRKRCETYEYGLCPMAMVIGEKYREEG